MDDEMPVDIARRKGNKELFKILEPSKQLHLYPPYLPYRVREAQSVCALRFEGDIYEEIYEERYARTSESEWVGSVFKQLVQPVVHSLILHQNNHHNFGAFFYLQRFLNQWGGEHLTKYSKEHIAYDFLFLHLYSHTPPTPFRNAEYSHKWQSKFLPQIEEIASVVRTSFYRKTSQGLSHSANGVTG